MRHSAGCKRDQGFFFNGQMLDFLYRILRRIVQRSSLPEEKDWEALRDFDFSSVEFLDVPSFMEKTDFGAKAMWVAEAKIDLEREKGKRLKPSDVIARSVTAELFNPFIDTEWAYICYVAMELTNHLTFASELVVGMASFDYAVLFVLPRLQAIDCYTCLFQSSC